MVQSRRRRRGRFPACKHLFFIPSRSQKPKTDLGFTLIELMVVLLLIGILSAMILPEMKGTYGDALLRSSGRELVNVFSLAYSQAVSQNQVHLVRLDQETGRFSLEREVRGQGGQSQSAPTKGITGSSGQLDRRITLEIHKHNDAMSERAQPRSNPSPTSGIESLGDENSVAFYPDGTADSAEILLHDRAGYGLRLRIDPVTARVEILPQTPEATNDH